MTIGRIGRRALLALFGLLIAGGAEAQGERQLQQIGVASQVRGEVFQMIAGRQKAQTVFSGNPVFLGDQLITGPNSRLRIELKDQTRFVIGPDARLTLDRFVYNRDRSEGNTLMATVLKGSFGFVSGKVAKLDPNAMTVRLPVGTIGIRGTIVAGEVKPEGVGIALLDPVTTREGRSGAGGEVIVRSRAGAVVIDQPYYGTDVAGPNKMPTEPKPWSDQRLRTLLAQLDDGEFKVRGEAPVTVPTDEPTSLAPAGAYPRPLDWFNTSGGLRVNSGVTGHGNTYVFQ